jgi:hypothetical protein
MQITKEFLESEISDLEQEIHKASAFMLKAQGTVEAYKMLINRLEAPEPEQQHDDAI